MTPTEAPKDTAAAPAADAIAADAVDGVKDPSTTGDVVKGATESGTGGDEKSAAPADVFGADPADGDGGDDTGAKDDVVEDTIPEGDYSFDLGEGREIDPVLAEAFAPQLKELKIGQTQANKLANVLYDALASKEEADNKAFVEQVTAWRAEAQADPEMGGAKWAATKLAANKALQAFGTPGLTEVLVQTQLANHPEMIRLFARMQRSIGDDKVDPGNVTTQAADQPVEERWYGTRK